MFTTTTVPVPCIQPKFFQKAFGNQEEKDAVVTPPYSHRQKQPGTLVGGQPWTLVVGGGGGCEGRQAVILYFVLYQTVGEVNLRCAFLHTFTRCPKRSSSASKGSLCLCDRPYTLCAVCYKVVLHFKSEHGGRKLEV